MEEKFHGVFDIAKENISFAVFSEKTKNHQMIVKRYIEETNPKNVSSSFFIKKNRKKKLLFFLKKHWNLNFETDFYKIDPLEARSLSARNPLTDKITIARSFLNLLKYRGVRHEFLKPIFPLDNLFCHSKFNTIGQFLFEYSKSHKRVNYRISRYFVLEEFIFLKRIHSNLGSDLFWEKLENILFYDPTKSQNDSGTLKELKIIIDSIQLIFPINKISYHINSCDNVTNDLSNQFNKQFSNELKEQGITPSKTNQTKFQLIENFEKDIICPYTNSIIESSVIFTPKIEIDHCIPKSLMKNESINNKVLTNFDTNHTKSNKLLNTFKKEDFNKNNEWNSYQYIQINNYFSKLNLELEKSEIQLTKNFSNDFYYSKSISHKIPKYKNKLSHKNYYYIRIWSLPKNCKSFNFSNQIDLFTWKDITYFVSLARYEDVLKDKDLKPHPAAKSILFLYKTDCIYYKNKSINLFGYVKSFIISKKSISFLTLGFDQKKFSISFKQLIKQDVKKVYVTKFGKILMNGNTIA